MNSSHSDKTIVTLPSNEHAAFEKWLLAEQGLDAQWDASRNRYMPFPAHVAWRAYRFGRRAYETKDFQEVIVGNTTENGIVMCDSKLPPDLDLYVRLPLGRGANHE